MARSLPFIALSFMASIVTGVFVAFDLDVVRLRSVVLLLLDLIAVRIAAGTLHTTLKVVDLLVGTG